MHLDPRQLLEQADPARDRPVPAPRLSAADLIALAGSMPAAGSTPVGVHPVRHRSRKLVIACATVVLTAGSVTAYVVARGGGDAVAEHLTPGSGGVGGPVIVPIAFEITESPPAAAAKLRELADRITDAPADLHTGRYAYHHWKGWGGAAVTSPEGHTMNIAAEVRSWIGADGQGQVRRTPLPPEFPTEEARRYWESHGLPDPGVSSTNQPEPVEPLPTGGAELAERLAVAHGPGAAAKATMTVYQRHVVPRPVRAEILRALAGVDEFRWRGTVTDRAGRTGVAITADDTGHNQRSVLVFDATTGELLAQELHSLNPAQVQVYTLFLTYDRTDQIG